MKGIKSKRRNKTKKKCRKMLPIITRKTTAEKEKHKRKAGRRKNPPGNIKTEMCMCVCVCVYCVLLNLKLDRKLRESNE